jgi:creatinine amidohydrolase
MFTPMLLAHCTWPDVERYLARSTGVLIPVGSIEQHGPTALIGTDAICAESIAEAAGVALAAMVAPPIPVGLAEHHMAFAGSMTLRKETFVAVIEDYTTSLYRHGFRRFYFVNGHGGNIATLNATLKDLNGNKTAPQAAYTFVNWWAGPRTKKLRTAWYGEGEGLHATPSEIAVTQRVNPMATKPARRLEPASTAKTIGTAETYRATYPDGRMGSDPALATPEAGRALIASAVEDIAEHYREFVAR